MKIRIYQLNCSRQPGIARAFSGLDRLSVVQKGDTTVHAEFYNKVFEGEVKASSLEDVYTLFNMSYPSDYKGRSMSISDVLELTEKQGRLAKGFYYCDSIGFAKIEFDAEKAGASL